MRRTWYICWHTLREMRWIALAALSLTIIPTLIELVDLYPNSIRSDAFMAGILTMYLSGVASVILGNAAIARVTEETVLRFWTSRPVNIARFLAVKFLFGYAICFLMFAFPVLLHGYFERMADEVYYHEQWSGRAALIASIDSLAFVIKMTLATYSIAFAVSALIRRSMAAIPLSLGLGLLFYFGPFVVPEFNFINIFQSGDLFGIVNDPRALPASLWTFRDGNVTRYLNMQSLLFFALIFLFSAAAWLVAVVSLRRNWMLQMNRRNLSWGLAIAGLLLLGGAARQIGSNLPLQKSKTSHLGYSCGISMTEGDQGIAAFGNRVFKTGMYRDMRYVLSLSRIDVSRDPMASEPFYQREYPGEFGYGSYEPLSSRAVQLPRNPNLVYLIDAQYEKRTTETLYGRSVENILSDLHLMTLDCTKSTSESSLHQLDLMPFLPPSQEPHRTAHNSYLKLFAADTSLYLCGNLVDHPGFLIRFDISSPQEPRFAQKSELKSNWEFDPQPASYEGGLLFSAALPALPGIKPEQLLQIAQSLCTPHKPYPYITEGNLMVMQDRFRRTIQTHKILGFDEKTTQGFPHKQWHVNLRLLDSYLLPPLQERILYTMTLSEGILALINDSPLNQGIIALDVRNPEKIRPIGYYTIPQDHLLASIAPLPGRRILAGGNKIHILGPIR